MSLQCFLASLVIAMPAAAILQTTEPAEQSICSSPTMASDSAHSPANVRALGSSLGVAPTAIDQTPDSEKVRRCLLREAEDKAPVDVREAIEIQPDKHLGSNRIALNDLVPLCRSKGVLIGNRISFLQITRSAVVCAG